MRVPPDVAQRLMIAIEGIAEPVPLEPERSENANFVQRVVDDPEEGIEQPHPEEDRGYGRGNRRKKEQGAKDARASKFLVEEDS